MNKSAQLEREQTPSTPVEDWRESRRRQRGSTGRGKLLLVVMFCVLRGIDALVYLGMPSGDKSRLLGSIITGAIWTTALLVAIWYRQNWARYTLTALLLMGVFVYFLAVPDLLESKGTNKSFLQIFIITGLTYAGIAGCLIRSRHIRRLTHRSPV